MSKKLYIRKVKGKGRGVFCKTKICKDDIIEICPLLVFPSDDHDTLVNSQLVDYFFNFNKEENTMALALGFGSLYNHARHSNAAYELDTGHRLMTYYALEDINPGTEICINYAGESGKDFSEWFEKRNIVYKPA